MNERARSPEAGVFSRLASWGRYMIGDTYSEANDGLKGQVVADIAERANRGTFDTLLDIVINDDLAHRPVAAPVRRRPEVVADARRGVGPPARDDRRLRRGRAPRPHVRRAVHDLVPRRLAARPSTRVARTLRAADDADAGRSSSGCATAVSCARATAPTSSLFDPETVATGEVKLVDDLPGGTSRLYADAIGVPHVFVNGTPIVDRRRRRPTLAPAPSCAAAATPTPCRSPPTPDPRAFLREFAPVSGG